MLYYYIISTIFYDEPNSDANSIYPVPHFIIITTTAQFSHAYCLFFNCLLIGIINYKEDKPLCFVLTFYKLECNIILQTKMLKPNYKVHV